MTKNIQKADAETGVTTAKMTKGKWIYIMRYENSDGTVEQFGIREPFGIYY